MIFLLSVLASLAFTVLWFYLKNIPNSILLLPRHIIM